VPIVREGSQIVDLDPHQAPGNGPPQHPMAQDARKKLRENGDQVEPHRLRVPHFDRSLLAIRVEIAPAILLPAAPTHQYAGNRISFCHAAALAHRRRILATEYVLLL
jgi:hypothetical protein